MKATGWHPCLTPTTSRIIRLTDQYQCNCTGCSHHRTLALHTAIKWHLRA